VSLLEYITDIFCFTEIGARKDTPEFWSRVFSTLKLGPINVAMVGDTLEQDVIPPRKYGVFAVWFNENHRSQIDAKGIPTVYRLPDVVPLVTNGPNNAFERTGSRRGYGRRHCAAVNANVRPLQHRDLLPAVARTSDPRPPRI
jgi:FMN phosphatase YigB (HAD superfamily)